MSFTEIRTVVVSIYNSSDKTSISLAGSLSNNLTGSSASFLSSLILSLSLDRLKLNVVSLGYRNPRSGTS